jgi:hypothetical protein
MADRGPFEVVDQERHPDREAGAHPGNRRVLAVLRYLGASPASPAT